MWIGECSGAWRVLGVVGLAAASVLPACAPPDLTFARVADDLSALVSPAQAKDIVAAPVTDGARVAQWSFGVDMNVVDYTAWLSSRPSGSFQLSRLDGGRLQFTRATAGDFYRAVTSARPCHTSDAASDHQRVNLG